jgi:hypothetical protein
VVVPVVVVVVAVDVVVVVVPAGWYASCWLTSSFVSPEAVAAASSLWCRCCEHDRVAAVLHFADTAVTAPLLFFGACDVASSRPARRIAATRSLCCCRALQLRAISPATVGDVSVDGDADIVQEQVLMLDSDYARAEGTSFSKGSLQLYGNNVL